ncbi:MAG: peptidoglycan-binding protein [Clostridia bacterium]|nr:peptidoglycan-binding protein [Clostridia bacterium]
MFCSQCGKSLSPDQVTCPHCGFTLGESKLNGNTSVQPVYLPGGKAEGGKPRYTPYTKVSYTSMGEEDSDVYSRTAYRPVLTETESTVSTGDQEKKAEAPNAEETQAAEEAPKTAAADTAVPENTAAPENAAEEAPKRAPRKEAADSVSLRLPDEAEAALQEQDLKRLQEVPEDAPSPDEAREIVEKELAIRIRPVQRIQKAGISPKVQSYMEQLESGKTKRSRRKSRKEENDGEEAESAVEMTAVSSDGEEEAQEEGTAESTRKTGGVGKWILRALGVLAILALVVGGVFYLVDRTTPRAPIEKVSLDLYEQGMELIKSHTTDSYRTQFRTLLEADPTTNALVTQQQSDLNAFDALMPNTPQENDELFIGTLKSIQENINGATFIDAVALSNAGDANNDDLIEESKSAWAEINNAMLRLEIAKTPDDLKNIQRGLEMASSTPEPEVEATPSPEETYKTLSRGMRNSKEVKALQKQLKLLGWFNSKIDADYGQITVTAIKKFQQAAGLEVTGIADPQTQALLYSDNAPREGSAVTPSPEQSFDESQVDVN